MDQGVLVGVRIQIDAAHVFKGGQNLDEVRHNDHEGKFVVEAILGQ